MCVYCVVKSLLLFFLAAATPEAYGSSQVRGPFGARPASLRHSLSNMQSEPHLRVTHTTTHGPRPGIESTSLWLLIGFISTAQQWELSQHKNLKFCLLWFFPDCLLFPYIWYFILKPLKKQTKI